jgi:hypothetical protein
MRSRFGVPYDNITSLFNENATRDNIISALHHLSTDDRIQRDDPILIYYAGHGASFECDRNLRSVTTTGKIEAILPHDYSHGVKAIPDRTLGSLIRKIANAKGNNIVSNS